MKRKQYSVLIAIFLTVLGLVSCAEDCNDQFPRDQIEGKGTLETAVTGVNEQLVAIKSILDKIQADDYITSVTPTENGYTIVFAKTGAVTIKHVVADINGANGSGGKDAPVISIAEFESVYYWAMTVDGKTDWMHTEDGKKQPYQTNISKRKAA